MRTAENTNDPRPIWNWLMVKYPTSNMNKNADSKNAVIVTHSVVKGMAQCFEDSLGYMRLWFCNFPR
jgi:hypothetical protein